MTRIKKECALSVETLPPMICGTEIEFSILLLGPKVEGKQTFVDPKQLNYKLAATLPDDLYSTGYFTSNGGRYYVDAGPRLEWATPECDSFEDVAIYELAGEEIVLHGLKQLKEKELIKGFRLNKRVVDSVGNYWGAHESYQIPRRFDPADKAGVLQRILSTHLATRCVMVGAGTVTNAGRFMIAQKAFSIQELASGSTTQKRGLINTRDEPHDDPEKYRRLHLIGGDANVSPWSIAMKVGTTAVMLRMIQERVPLDDLALEHPDYVGRLVAADPTLQETVEVASGKKMTGVEIQVELAARAYGLSLRRPLPPAEVEIINEWQWAAEQLQFDPTRLMDLSDWVTRKAILDRHKEKHPGSKVKTPKEIEKLQAIDIQTDSLGEKPGGMAKRRDRSGLDMTKVKTAITEPPSTTRAHLRGHAIRHNAEKAPYDQTLTGVNWHILSFGSKTVKLTARQTSCSRLKKLLA